MLRSPRQLTLAEIHQSASRCHLYTPLHPTYSTQMRVDRCDFSGYKVYPSRGKVYVRGDSKVREIGTWAQPRQRSGAASGRTQRRMGMGTGVIEKTQAGRERCVEESAGRRVVGAPKKFACANVLHLGCDTPPALRARRRAVRRRKESVPMALLCPAPCCCCAQL